MNDYTDFGNYYCSSGGVAATLLNCPISDSGFVLHVERTTGDTSGAYLKQRIVANKSAATEFWRTLLDSTYKDWIIPLTNTNYIIRGTGTVTVTVPATKTADTGVSFSVSYPEVPHVIVFGSSASACYLSATALSRTVSGFTIRAYNPTANAVTADLRWITLY